MLSFLPFNQAIYFLCLLCLTHFTSFCNGLRLNAKSLNAEQEKAVLDVLWRQNKHAQKLSTLGAKKKAQSAKADQADSAESPKTMVIFHYEEQRHDYYESLLAKPWAAVAQKYIEQLAAEEAELMKEFFELTGISQKEFDALAVRTVFILEKQTKEKVEEVLKKNEGYQESVLDGYKKRVSDLLAQLGLHHIKIVVNVSMHCSSVYSGIYQIGIDHIKHDDKLNKSKHAHCMATRSDSTGWDLDILHEIMHVLHNDSLIQGCMICWKLKNERISLSKEHPFILKYSRFCEKRADILAGLSGPSVTVGIRAGYGEKSPPVRANESMLNKAIRTTREKRKLENSTHPKNDDRIDYLNQLHQEMLEAIEKSKK